MAEVDLTAEKVEAALASRELEIGLGRYLAVQAQLSDPKVVRSRDFQRRFNGFYRVRRNQQWQDVFFARLERELIQPSSFSHVLEDLWRSTGRIEASFASKLVATVRPDEPVLDSVVLDHHQLRLRRTGDPLARLAQAGKVYDDLRSKMTALLASPTGRHVIQRFREVYPDANLTEMKMLDLVLWQIRS